MYIHPLCFRLTHTQYKRTLTISLYQPTNNVVLDQILNHKFTIQIITVQMKSKCLQILLKALHVLPIDTTTKRHLI